MGTRSRMSEQRSIVAETTVARSKEEPEKYSVNQPNPVVDPKCSLGKQEEGLTLFSTEEYCGVSNQSFDSYFRWMNGTSSRCPSCKDGNKLKRVFNETGDLLSIT